MSNLEVGRSVFLKAIGNNARYDRERIEEWKIKKIGRKYFEVWRDEKDFTTIQFYIEDNRQKMDYPDWDLYFSRQEIEDEKESVKLIDEIRKVFSYYGEVNLSLSQLRSIIEIIRGK